MARADGIAAKAAMSRVYLGLGGNVGDREAALRHALAALSPKVAVGRVSPLYETAPVGYEAQGPFLNAVAEVETALPPEALLPWLKEVEERVGRRPGARWGPRVVDIDILSYDVLVLETPSLQIPHARLRERAFVLAPLADLSPAWRHPATGETAEQLLTALQPVSGVAPYKKDWWPK